MATAVGKAGKASIRGEERSILSGVVLSQKGASQAGVPQAKPTPQADHNPGQPLNDAEAYGVRFEPVKVASGQWYWRVVNVHHLSSVLFDPAGQPATAVHLLLAQEYLLTFRPAFGFNPAEAAGASRVTIIANEKSAGAQIVADPTAGGATVERISGTAAEVVATLTERVARK